MSMIDEYYKLKSRMDLIELFKGTLQAENVSQNEIAINQLAK